MDGEFGKFTHYAAAALSYARRAKSDDERVGWCGQLNAGLGSFESARRLTINNRQTDSVILH